MKRKYRDDPDRPYHAYVDEAHTTAKVIFAIFGVIAVIGFFIR